MNTPHPYTQGTSVTLKGLMHGWRRLGLGRWGGWWVHEECELYGRQPAEAGLASAAVVAGFDPAHDRDSRSV